MAERDDADEPVDAVDEVIAEPADADVSLVEDDSAEETETADAVSEDREAATVGATAGSARAAARRSGAAARAGLTPTKGTATRARVESEESRGSIFARLGRFFREVVAELRKVIWPARNQMVTYTIVVIVFVVVMVALVAVLDLLFAKGVLAIFG